MFNLQEHMFNPQERPHLLKPLPRFLSPLVIPRLRRLVPCPLMMCGAGSPQSFPIMCPLTAEKEGMREEEEEERQGAGVQSREGKGGTQPLNRFET